MSHARPPDNNDEDTVAILWLAFLLAIIFGLLGAQSVAYGGEIERGDLFGTAIEDTDTGERFEARDNLWGSETIHDDRGVIQEGRPDLFGDTYETVE